MKRIQCITFALALAVLMPGCDNPVSEQGQEDSLPEGSAGDANSTDPNADDPSSESNVESTGNIIRSNGSVPVSELCRVLLSMGCEVGKLYNVNGKYVTSNNGSIKTAEDYQIVIQESFFDSGNRKGVTARNGVTVRYDISWTTQKYELWFCGKPYICDKTDDNLSNIVYEKQDSSSQYINSYNKASGVLSQSYTRSTGDPDHPTETVKGPLDGKTASDPNASIIIRKLCEPGDLAIMSIDTSRGYDDSVPGPFELRVRI